MSIAKILDDILVPSGRNRVRLTLPATQIIILTDQPILPYRTEDIDLQRLFQRYHPMGDILGNVYYLSRPQRYPFPFQFKLERPEGVCHRVRTASRPGFEPRR